MQEEFEAKKEALLKKEEEYRQKRKELLRQREQLWKDIDDYIENGAKTPEALREVSETQPGKDLCPFFTKTGACRLVCRAMFTLRYKITMLKFCVSPDLRRPFDASSR